MRNNRNEKQNQENDEEYFRNAGSRDCDSGKSEDASDQSNHQKHQSPIKHISLLPEPMN
jgi:hypothetical protein